MTSSPPFSCHHLLPQDFLQNKPTTGTCPEIFEKSPEISDYTDDETITLIRNVLKVKKKGGSEGSLLTALQRRISCGQVSPAPY
jgi:hypothetical protein